MATRKPRPAAGSPQDRRSVIVTSKPKDQLRDKVADKVGLLMESVPRAETVAFYDVASAAEFERLGSNLEPCVESFRLAYRGFGQDL